MDYRMLFYPSLWGNFVTLLNSKEHVIWKNLENKDLCIFTSWVIKIGLSHWHEIWFFKSCPFHRPPVSPSCRNFSYLNLFVVQLLLFKQILMVHTQIVTLICFVFFDDHIFFVQPFFRHELIFWNAKDV